VVGFELRTSFGYAYTMFAVDSNKWSQAFACNMELPPCKYLSLIIFITKELKLDTKLNFCLQSSLANYCSK